MAGVSFATAEEVETIRGIWGTVVGRDFESARDWALKRLREDLAKADEGEHPDAYLYRANAVPLGLMGAGQFAMAEEIYDKLVAEVDAFNKSEKTRKHRGALLANQAVCQLLLGRFDSGVPRLVFTVEDEDWKTFGPPQSVTPAMNHLRNLVERPAQMTLAMWAEVLFLRATGAKTTTDDFEEIAEVLGNAKWSLYATVLRTQETWETYQRYKTPFAPPRLLDGIRGLTSALEHLAKTIGRNSCHPEVMKAFAQAERLTLYDCYNGLFDSIGLPWWTAVATAVQSKLTRFNASSRGSDFRRKMGEILSWDAADLDSLTARCLALSILVRNYAAHELEPSSKFAAESDGFIPFVESLTHCAAALRCLMLLAVASGHIEGSSGA